MDSSQILVTGFPDDTTKTELVIYFQSERDSGGGDVESIEIDRGRAVVSFESAEAAIRVFSRPDHLLRDCPLQVALLPKQTRSNPKGAPSTPSLVKDSPDGSSTSERRERSRASNDTQVANQQTDPTSHRHDLLEERSEYLHETAPHTNQQCTIEVTGLPDGATEDMVMNYFENAKRSKGGPVSNVAMNPELKTCQVTFESPDDAIRTVDHFPHNLSGACLNVSLVEDFEEDTPDGVEEGDEEFEESITIIISGISASTTEDAVCNYFENSRRSGGGEVYNVDYNDNGEPVLTFLEVKDLQRLLEGAHSINGKPITVTRQRPKKRVPPDPVRIHVQGLSEKTTADCLCFYLEKFSGDVEVLDVNFGSNNNALVVFKTEPDFQMLFEKVHKDTKGLERSKPRLERVPICTSVHVSGLKKETSDETISLYFENEKRSGGKDVSHVERKGKDEALVHFEDPTSVQNVIQKNHSLEGKQLTVMPHYPFLQDTTAKKTEMNFDPDVLYYIQMNHERELEMVLGEFKVQVELSKDSQNITVSPSDNKKDSGQSWEERVGHLESFLQSFKKTQLDIASEIFDEIAQRWKKQSSIQGPCNFLLSFDDHRRLVQIIGKVTYVEKEEQKLQELIQAVKEDTELMKSVVQVVEDNIPKERLTLLEMSGICERLRDKHRHLSIAVDRNGQKLCLKGPRSVLQDVRVELFTFISKMIEQTIELPAKVLNVLKRPQVSRFIQDLLKQKGIQAVVLYDQGQSSNEGKVVGVDLRNTKEAKNLLQDAIQEKSHHLSVENTQVLQSHIWKDFQSSVAQRFKVGVTVDKNSGTVWVSGITEDVQKCFKEVETFLETNTIVHDMIPIEHGTTRFLSEVWKTRLDGIKTELAHCSIDMRVAADGEGIEVSGTNEGLKKCLPQLRALINAVQTDSVPIDKPGMRKFFLQGKGPILLKATEEKHHCIILPSERDKEKTLASDTVVEEDEVGSASELICSYVTKEKKKISLFKGDITKERVDAIVNAANGDLNHIGGLAAAIVRAGGKEIQDKCTAFVRDNGPLLEGQTMVTTAGKLPCKQVIHAVGPKWDSTADKMLKESKTTKQERYLKYAVISSLKEAAKLTSIAIPAVSSGVFGVPRNLCAKVILDAVLDFCEETPHCRLSEIHLINNDDPTVTAFAEEMRTRFAKERNFKEPKSRRPASAVGLGANSRASGVKMTRTPRSLTTQGIRITVKVGDLAKEQADILVGTAASNLKLNQNPCARALSQAAGPSLQQECTNIGDVAVGDIAVTNQPGNLNCKVVIFAICSEWDSGKGKKVLKRLLAKCLQTASAQGMTSIAFPAIGTGTLQFPRAEVAEIYFDEVMSYNQKNPTTSIKEVRFVLYDQDDPTVQAFNAELKKRMESNAPLPVRKRADSMEKRLKTPAKDFQASSSQNTAFSPLRERDQDHLETNVGTLCFKVQPGDITKETTEAIVVISNKDLDIERGGGAGAAILKAGGHSIQHECSQKGPQLPGSVVVTSAGTLETRFIFHIVPSKHLNDKSIQASVMKCLQEAEKKGLSSISFPAIGTGNLGVSARECAQTMLSAIRVFNDQQPISMQLIKMVIFQKEMVKDVRMAIEEASGETSSQKPGIIRRVVSRVGDFLGLGDSEKKASSPAAALNDYDKTFDLLIFAGCKENLQGAVKEINEVMKEKSTKDSIENEAIFNLSTEHLRRIHTLEQRYDVKASVEKEVGRIVVHGQTGDVLAVVKEIHNILHQVKEDEHERKRAEALSKDIQWMYKDVDTGVFVDFEPHINAKIETAYHEKKTGGVAIKGGRYSIDFNSMTEKDIYGTGVTEVQRLDRRGVLLPKHWTPQPKDQNGKEKTVHLVQLDPIKDAQEYQSVQSRFQQTCANGIVTIQRVQNPALYGTYAIRKQKMDEAKGSNEKCLFHGTSGETCQLINHTGFNRSFRGKNDTVHGNGVYFALNASYSARSTYSPPDMSGFRYMYLTRVLVGEYAVGKRGYLTPPPKNSADLTDTYDTVVDQIPNPAIFVVFYDWQCYPEYLITFQ